MATGSILGFPCSIAPIFNLLDAPINIVSDLINPKSPNVPTEFKQSLITKLISIAQFSVPIAVVHLAVNFYIQLSSIR